MKLLQKIFATAILVGAVAVGYSNSFELAGVVKNVNSNEPVADHLVYIAPLSGNDTIATTTDAEGFFMKKLELNDNGTFLGSVITIDPCSGAMNYQVLAVQDSSYFVEINVCGNSDGDCFAMFEYYNGVSSIVVGGEDSLSTEDYTVQFVNVSTKTNSYAWDFGDGETSTEENPYHTFPSAGSYEVSLAIKNDSCESSYITSVWVDEPKPLECETWFYYNYRADSVYFENDSLNENPTNPLEVKFTDFSVQTNTYWKWNFGDGTTSTEQNPTHVYDKSGMYFVSLEAGNDECSGVSEQTLILEPVGAVCYGAIEYVVGDYVEDDSLGLVSCPVEFFDVSTGNPDRWSWDFGDGEYSEEQNPVHYYKSAGVYSIILFAGNDSCFSTSYAWVTVIDNGESDSLCMADFIVEYQDCVGDSTGSDCILFPVEFHNISFGEFTDWYWEFGDGETSTEQSPVHNYVSGDYEVILKAIGPACESYFYQYISINSDPTDSIWEPETCLAMFYPILSNEHTVEFINESYGEIHSYYWDFGDGTTSTESNPTHTYADIDEWYQVSLTIESADSCFSTFIMELWLDDYESDESIIALFIPEINGTEVVFHNESQGEIENYHWNFGDGTTAESKEASHIYAELGTYIVTLGVSNNDAVTTFTMEIDLVNSTFKGMSTNGVTGVSNVREVLGKMSVHPNPMREQANVYLNSTEASSASIQILNIAGQTLMQKQVELVKGDNNFSVNTESLNQGIYLLNVISPMQTKSLKITK